MVPLHSLPSPQPDWAVFLDVDGTLVEIAATPRSVRPEPDVISLLTEVKNACGGALAIVSGRALDDIDRLFAPLRLPVAGLHGLERRNARGEIFRPKLQVEALAKIRARLNEFARAAPGAVVEDKGLSVALHYRGAPRSEAAARKWVDELVGTLGDRFHVQEGKMVLEIKPTGVNKGTVIRTFMVEPPFAGRKPIFIGDDITDEQGFQVVNRLGGHSIRVGGRESTAATSQVGTVTELLAWLSELPAAIESATPS